MRLDQYVAQFWPEYSRSTWQKYIEAGYVLVNSEVVTSTKYALDEDDHVEVNVPEQTDFSNESLPIIYEDDDVIVINKPVGVLTHSKGAMNDEFTVAEFVRPKTAYHAATNRPGIIHRLDRATSGVIICAKNDASASYLQRQFSDRKVKKTYMAVVSGVPKQEKAIIDLPIARNPSAPSTFKVDAAGKPAETSYEIIKSNGTRTLVKLMPRTGRTHQLRVHMAYLGTPIVGDIVYGSEKASRMFLHAASLEITLPSRERRTFESPVPEEFQEAVKK
ncbi:MAG TPA: RluA family pseudouridine synthase [Candidatus Saccharibacteria bacterium]|nr:RluA family pseudouridine synthase [Candidatus Saccharibacteria bacterium]HRK94275.1 RluA family pseudouridine synthase [Candidatus Saccharibacteria bacterium]